MSSFVREDEFFEFGVGIQLVPEAHEELNGLIVEAFTGEGFRDGVNDTVFITFDSVGGLGVQRSPTLRAEPGSVPQRRLALRADLQRGATDGEFFVGGEPVVGSETVHHLLVVGLVVPFEDVGVGCDTNHELDSVVSDTFIAHTRDGSVSEVVGLDALGVDAGLVRDLLQTVVSLGMTHRVARFPRNHVPVFVRPFTSLCSAEERGVGIASARMVFQPRRDVGASPEERSRSTGTLETLRVVVESDGRLPGTNLDVVEDDTQRGSDSLSCDAEERDECGVPGIRTGLEESIDFVAVDDLLGSDWWALGGADDDLLTPVAVEFVSEEETSCLSVLANAPITEPVSRNGRVRAIVEGVEQVHDFGVVFEVDEWLVGSFTHQADATEPSDEGRVGDVLAVGPADDGVTILAGFELLDLFNLGLESTREVVDVFDAHRSDKHRVGEIIKLSSGLLHEIRRRLCRLPRRELTSKPLLTPSFSPTVSSPGSSVSGGVPA